MSMSDLRAPQLIREHHTDLTPFEPSQIDSARMEWVYALNYRLGCLNSARGENAQDLEYGGAAGICENFADLEAAVDEARRMVYVLSTEMRRRSEGEMPVWNQGQSQKYSQGSSAVGVTSMMRNKSAV